MGGPCRDAIEADPPDLTAIAEAMHKASDICAQIIGLEERLGISNAPIPERLTVRLVDGNDVCCRCGGPNLCEKCGEPRVSAAQRTHPRGSARTIPSAG